MRLLFTWKTHLSVFCLLIIFAFHISLAQDITPDPSQLTTSTPFRVSDLEVTPAYNVSNLDQLPTFAALFETPNCAPPCFWSLKPGQSTADDIFDVLYRAKFLKNLSDGAPFYLNRTNDRITQDIIFSFTKADYTTTSVNFLVDRQVLKWVNMQYYAETSTYPVDKGSLLSIPFIFRQIKSIPEIYINDQSNKGGFFTNDVDMSFLYRDVGVLLSYNFDFSRENNKEDAPKLTICPNIDHVTTLNWWFWNPKDDTPRDIAGVLSSVPGFGTVSIDKFLRVDAESFVDYFRDPAKECLITEFIK